MKPTATDNQSAGGGATVEFEIHLAKGARGAVEVRQGAAPPPPPETAPTGCVPRVARLAALALRIDEMVRSGDIRDYADVARLGHVTRARVAQIAGLACLAPDILEEILHLPPTVKGRDRVTERDLRAMTGEPDWSRQRAMWKSVRSRAL
jgi:hypothetical protein